MKTRAQIKLQVLEEMPYASDLQVEEEVDRRLGEQNENINEEE